MAKTTTCNFCGKELTKGFFKGEDYCLSVGDYSFDCCKECYDHYKQTLKELGPDRLKIKLANYKYFSRTKLSTEQVLQMIQQYIAEAEEKHEAVFLPKRGEFYNFDEFGRFNVAEMQFGLMGESDKRKVLIKSLDSLTGAFTKDDVSCIQYRICGREETGLFHTAYMVELCFNTGFTYKPCYTRTAVEPSGIFNMKAKARKQVVAELALFKQRIGCTLPIQEVKKFR